MTDGIIKGSGNSRFLKSVANALTLYPTHESLMEALAAGTLPVDLNGINPAGWETQGTALNKANLLTDALCTALGLANTATPTQAMDKLRQIIQTGLENSPKVQAITYVGTGQWGQNSPCVLSFPFAPNSVIFLGYERNNEWGSYNGYVAFVGACSLQIIGPEYNQYKGLWANNPSTSFAKKSSDGKTLYWYNTYDARSQLNEENTSYYFLAFG